MYWYYSSNTNLFFLLKTVIIINKQIYVNLYRFEFFITQTNQLTSRNGM